MKVLLVVVIAVVFYLTFAPQTEVVQEESEQVVVEEAEQNFLDARPAANQIVDLWGDWDAIAQMSDDPELLSFHLRIHSLQVREEQDPRFVPVNDVNSTRVASVRTQDKTANISIENVYKGVRRLESFDLVYDDEWKIVSPEWNGCPGTYRAYCRKEFATHFNNISYCEGPYLFECYRHFNEQPPLELAKEICDRHETKKAHDECLFNLRPDESVCSLMQLQQNRYTCFGLFAGSQGDIDLCLERITSNLGRDTNVAQCVTAYVLATGENECDRISGALESERCYDLLES